MSDPFALATLLVAGLFLPHTAPAQPDLRARVERAAEHGISPTELSALADEALLLAGASGSRSAFWSAISLVGVLCESGPPVEAREVRARALELLVQRDSDTMRWSSLTTR